MARELALEVAKQPETLDQTEWRLLEMVVALVLEGLGLEVTLTPPAKDGGKDVIAECHLRGRHESYLIEMSRIGEMDAVRS